MLKEHGLRGSAKLCDVILQLKDARCELLIYLEEGLEVLLACCVGGMVTRERGYEAWVFKDGLKIEGSEVVSSVWRLGSCGSYDLSLTTSGSQPSSIVGGAGSGFD